MKTALLGTLERICRIPGLKTRKTVERPWRIKVKEEVWALATDARVMLMLRTPGGDLPEMPPGVAKDVLGLIALPVGGSKVKLPRLAKWAGTASWETSIECLECRGSGKDSYGECGECDGKGSSPVFPQNPGILLGHVFNRNYFACVLPAIDASGGLLELREHGPLSHRLAVLSGEGFRMWLMSIKKTAGAGESYPEFEMPGKRPRKKKLSRARREG